MAGDADVAEVRSAADAASRRLGRDVNVAVLTLEEGDGAGTGWHPNPRSARSNAKSATPSTPA
jgi:hypothetical protein